MPEQEVVYTVHKFEAENVDEISINVGEQVIVLEKDEGFNDGWWQVKNQKKKKVCIDKSDKTE